MLIDQRSEQRENRWKFLVSLLVNQGDGVQGSCTNRRSFMFLVLRDIYTPNKIKCKLIIKLVIKRVGYSRIEVTKSYST